MDKLPELTVFLPAYNEEPNISDTLDNVYSVLQEVAEKFEILVINDGSKDKTEQIVSQKAQSIKEIRVINHEVNKGYGAAVKTGIYSAQFEYIAFIDSDGQFDFNEIKTFIPFVPEHDLVIGYRKNRAEGFKRWFIAKSWGVLVLIATGLRIRDIDCAFKLFKKKVITTIPKLEADGAMISAEFLAKCQKYQFKIKQLPVTHHPRKSGNPTGANVKVIIKALKELYTLRKNLS